MKAMGPKYRWVFERITGSMSRTQALRLKALAEAFDEAARRIDTLKVKIALADSF